MIDVVLLASGKSTRMIDDKMLLPIGDDICLTRLVEVFSSFEEVSNIYLVMRDDLTEIFCTISKTYTAKSILYVKGGDSRSESVFNALKCVSSPYVLIHDGARPFVSRELVSNIIECLRSKGSAIPVLPIVDSLRKVVDGQIVDFVDRTEVFAAQTPQGFKTEEILRAYNLANGKRFTDESELFKRYISPPFTIIGEEKNKKLTSIGDYLNLNCRVGYGFDVHSLAENQSLVLGGVTIPHNKGTVAHSDGDVVMHAIIDAIFSAIGERDIGCHFSDTDAKYKCIDSGILLKETYDVIYKLNYKILNISATIMAEKPKINPYIENMKQNIAAILKIAPDKIGINATTTEMLGIIGDEKGIAVSAIVTLI